MDLNKIVPILIVVFAIVIVVSIVKNVAKLIIVILTAILIFIIVQSVTMGINPLDMLKNTQNTTAYTKQIYNYSGKIKDSVNNTINDMEKNSSPELKSENSKLHEYLQQVNKLPHSVELDKFHQQYTKYLNDIVSASDTAVNGSDVKDGTLKNISEIKTQLNKYISELTQLKLN